MPTSVSISSLDTYTNFNFIPGVVDNVFLSSIVLNKLKGKKKVLDGGDQIYVPVLHSDGSDVSGRWGGSFDTFATQTIDPHTTAVFDPRYYAATMTLAKTDLVKNAGSKTKLVDMLAAQAEVAEMTFKDKMGTDIYLVGTADSNGRRGFDGLMAVCTVAANPSTGSYGGITRVGATASSRYSPTGNAFWNSNVIAANANTTTTFWKTPVTMDGSTVLTLAKMQSMFSACTVRPKLIVCSTTIMNKYHSLLTATQRSLTDEDTGKAGFDNLIFNANVPVVADDAIDASGSMYFLNFDHLKLYVWEGMDFKPGDFKEMINQAGITKQILFMGNLVCDKPNSLGLITGLTAA